MGQESETKERHDIFKNYQVNQQLMSLAKVDAKVMHCLPAHRGDEITDEVIDGPQSIVFDESENRMHVQKAIIVKLLGKA
jgi:ornithine carbamoyltransferase